MPNIYIVTYLKFAVRDKVHGFFIRTDGGDESPPLSPRPHPPALIYKSYCNITTVFSVGRCVL